MKTCTNCEQPKLLSEFHIDKSRKDGHRNDCKNCHKIFIAKYQKTTKGKVVHNKTNRKYRKTDKGKAARQRCQKRFKTHHPNRIKAKDAVKSAIRADKLPRANTLRCHYCPKQAQEYHHYLGYAPEHWLDVVPACCECHKIIYRRIAI